MIHRNRASQLQALADETRLKILKRIGSGSPSATDINLSLRMSQPRVAHHLKILVGSGLVDARRDGRFMRYTLPTTGFEAKLARVVLDSLGEAGERDGNALPIRSIENLPGISSGRGAVKSRTEIDPPAPSNPSADDQAEKSPGGLAEIEDYLL